ncbi:hypothetical protein J2X36_004726 [Methylobacterium sp. BE186]|uniref:hypothetical protein n=1 Tax=Methylobacterium sp. BE186 TaxID=2817715 RepID=UPI00285CFFFF|nr:hypothetical protein [Methylobacterium sp. BE186]MDR7039948.1 hypothetical protein [Methylobacterium sp. BE186]
MLQHLRDAGWTLPEALVTGLTISDEELERPALLTLWPHGVETKAVEPREIETLRQALGEAFAVLEDDTGMPWITTDGGTILSPSVLSCLSRSDAVALPLEPVAAVAQDRAPAAQRGRPSSGHALRHGWTDPRPDIPPFVHRLGLLAGERERRPLQSGARRARSGPALPG